MYDLMIRDAKKDREDYSSRSAQKALKRRSMSAHGMVNQGLMRRVDEVLLAYHLEFVSRWAYW